MKDTQEKTRYISAMRNGACSNTSCNCDTCACGDVGNDCGCDCCR